MVDAVSTTAGSPTCDCSNPDSCIHSIKVTPKGGSKSFEYKQSGSLPDIYLHDKDGKGAEVDIAILSKGCVSGSSGCPAAALFSDDNDEYFGDLTPGSHMETLTFVDDIEQKVENYNIVDLVSVIALGKIEDAPNTKYELHVGECGGYPIPSKTFTTKSGKQASMAVGPLMASVSSIYVLPKYDYELGVTVAYGLSVDELSDNERRTIMKQSNLESGHNPNHIHTASKGWTKKVPGMSVNQSLSMKGNAKLTIGSDTKEFSADIVQKEFTQYKDDLSMLKKSELALSTLNKMFAQSDAGKVKLASIEFKYPKLTFTGKGTLTVSNNTGSPYLERSVFVGLDPLIGVSLKLDFIQAFATAYGVERIVAKIREQALEMEEAFKRGENAAYAGAELFLLVSGALKAGFEVKSNEQKEYEYQLGSAVGGELLIRLATNIRGGVRYWIVEGSFEAGASAEAKAMFELDSPKEDQLDLVFFHNGIVAKVSVDASVGIRGKEGKQSTPTGSGKFSKSSNGSIVGQTTKTTGASGGGNNKNSLYAKDWVLYKKLSKSESNYRIRII